MPSYEQLGPKTCPKCKTETKNKKCPCCGAATRGTGSWSVRFRVLDAYGREKNKRLSGFDTKSAAQAAYVEFMKSYVSPNVKRASEITFGELYAKYIAHISARLKESSVYDLDGNGKKHLLPYFEKDKAKNIDKLRIKAWQDDLNLKGYSYKYKSKLRTLLSSIFKFGIMYYDVAVNPVSQVEPFRNTDRKPEMQIWTVEDFTKFISKVDDVVHKALFSLLYLTGCRKGEALALTWQDIDTDTATINIYKSITRKEPGIPYAVTTPKNKSSNRRILIPQHCLDLLAELRHKQALDGFNDSSAFLFYGDRPLPENTLSRAFKQYCALAGVKQIRIHDLRHSHASLLLANGENILLVAKRLGHGNIEQTLNTYSHLMPSAERDLVSKIDIDF